MRPHEIFELPLYERGGRESIAELEQLCIGLGQPLRHRFEGALHRCLVLLQPARLLGYPSEPFLDLAEGAGSHLQSPDVRHELIHVRADLGDFTRRTHEVRDLLRHLVPRRGRTVDHAPEVIHYLVPRRGHTVDHAPEVIHFLGQLADRALHFISGGSVSGLRLGETGRSFGDGI